MQREILLGRTPEGERVTVEIALRPAQRVAPYETITHEPLPDDALELSIVGTVYPKGWRPGWSESGGGQCIDTARTVLPSKQWSAEDLSRLVAIWEAWHLNGLQAGCAHQSVVMESGPYGPRPSLELTQPCPVTGYRYGHAWLFKALPADVLDDVRRFQRRVGYPGYTL